MQSDASRSPRNKSSRQRLADRIKEFLDATGMSPTPFGLMAASDDKLLWRIENARFGISLDKADRIYSFIDVYERSIRLGKSPALAIKAAKTAAAALNNGKRTDYAHQPRNLNGKTSAGRSGSRSVRDASARSPCAAEG